ncbi:crossover junction endonuclease eme1 [Chamberlinius hualienensis]
MSRYPVHVLSSSESDGDDVYTTQNNVNTQPSVAPVVIDLSDDDEYLCLPLEKRLAARAKGIQSKNSESSKSEDSLPSLPTKPCLLESCSSTASCAPYTKVQTTNFPSESNDDFKNWPDLDFISDDVPSSLPSSTYSSNENYSDHISSGVVKSQKKAKRSKEEILAEQEQRFKACEEKRKAREALATAKEKEKMMRNIRRQDVNSIKPGECIKNITVKMDMQLLELPESANISKALEEATMKFEVVEQFIKNTITWTRKIVQSTLEDDLKISQECNNQEEDQILVLLTINEFIIAVKSFKMDKHTPSGLVKLVHQIKELYLNKRITIVTCGLEKHFSAQRSRQQRQYRQHILNSDEPTQTNRRKRKMDNDSDLSISHSDVEEVLVDLQIREPCTLYMLSDSDELARLVVSITKAVAESPFKQERMGSDLSWASNVETKDSVKVDKEGNGLKLLWQRQLQQLHLVSSDTAQAIMSHYPTPASLITAYRKCTDIQQRQKLLQDITVRRGVGPLSSSRRIGPELSRKLYILLTSKNEKEMLDTYQC